MRLPSLKYLRTFQYAARHLSFRAAADALYITPSAVSHQIRALEEQLGLPLFERVPQGLALSSAGARYFATIDVLFGRLESATEQLVDRYGRSQVRVQLPALFGSELFLPKLLEFQANNPETDIRIESLGTRSQPSFASADLAITVGTGVPEGCTGHRLFNQRLVLVAAANSCANADGCTEVELDGMDQVVVAGRSGDWDLLARSLGRGPLRSGKQVHVDTMYKAVRAAEQGLGVALLGWPLCARWVDGGSLVRLLADDVASGEAYYVLQPEDEPGSPESLRLLTWILSEFTEA